MWYLENVLVPNWKSEILCLTETWLQPHSTMNTHLALPNYTMYRRDRPNSQHGGGLVVYTLSDLCTVRRPDLEHSNIECIAIQITLSRNMKHFIFACYRPPNESPDVFFGTLSRLLDAASQESSYLTLLGDFNAKHRTWDSQTNTAGNRLFQLLLDFGLSQCVKEPTRFSSNLQSSSTIDLYATTRPDLVRNVNVTDPISDHCCVTVETTDPHIKPGPSEMLFDDFSRADWSGMLKALSQAPPLHRHPRNNKH